jgi:hypothetical protein
MGYPTDAVHKHRLQGVLEHTCLVALMVRVTQSSA